ncbi:MAG: T9SS type A sorting domain-containing protein [Saprospiraceae bacterium]|nr:T9SS type A sorting domain-containing protein [Saprospiraceae bacterium]
MICCIILVFIFGNTKNIHAASTCSYASVFEWDSGSYFCNSVTLIDTRLCGIYGDGEPDISIGTDVNSDEKISKHYSLDGSGGITPPTGTLIYVQGILRIDKNFRGNSLRFKMGDGAKIIIENNGSFYAAGCKFFSCDKMWRGIEAVTARTISFVNSKIEDAEYAISLGPKPNIGLLNTEFSLNFVGIRNLGKVINLGACVGNTFRGDQYLDLREYYNSDDEIMNHYVAGSPYAGILLNNSTISIGRSTGTNNFIFSRVLFGILATNSSTLVVNGCNFNHIYGSELDTWGAGIWIENSSLNCSKSSFSDIFYAGIFAQESKFDTKNSTFSHCTNGIFSVSNILGEQINLVGNTFTMNTNLFEDTKTSNVSLDNFGIWLSRSSGSGGLINTIYQNKFYIGGSNTNAFSAWIAESSGSFGGEQLRFNENKSTITSSQDMVCGYKLMCHYSNYITIEEDTFYFNNSSLLSMRNSITAEDALGFGHQILSNRFTSTSSRTMNIGFYGENFPKANYCDNQFDNVRTCFFFTGNCDRSSLATSLFQNSNLGVYIGDKASEKGRLGIQDRKSNVWDCTIPIGSDAAINATSVALSKIFIETDNCTKFPQTGISPPNGWFFRSNLNTSIGCNIPSIGDTCNEINGFSVFDKNVLSNTYPEGPANGIHIYNADYQLLYRIWNDSSKLNCDTLAQDYFTAKRNSTAGKLSQVFNAIKIKVEIPTAIQDELDEIQTDRDEIYNSIDTLNENYSWVDTLVVDTVYQNALLQFQESLFELANQEDSLYAEVLEYRIDAFDTLLIQNAAIATDSVWEDNLKFLNEFVILLLTGQAETTDFDQVEAIADQNFDQGGMAVLHARVWFPQYSDESSLAKNKDLLPEGEILVTELALTNVVEIYPIPIVTNTLTIRSENRLKSIIVMDAQGRIWISKELSDSQYHTLNLTDLQAGVYLIELKFWDGTIRVKKIMKQ